MNKSFALISIGMLVVAGIAAVPLAATVENKTNQVIQILEKVTQGSFDTLDRGWEIALKFKDPNYKYDPKELGEPPVSLSKAMENVTITEEDLLESTG
jgi:hypothetical protein